MNAGGTGVVVWEQFDGALWRLWSNRYLPGGGWQTPLQILSDSSTDVFGPQIALNDSGVAFAVCWDTQGRYVWANRADPSGTWGTAQLLSSDPSGGIGSVDIAVAPDGTALVAWTQKVGAQYQILSRKYVPGTGWAPSLRLDTPNTGDALDPVIRIDKNGNAIAVWSQSDGTGTKLYANRYATGVGWGSEVALESDTGNYSLGPCLAFDGSGNATVVWQRGPSMPGDLGRIRSIRYQAGTGWDAAYVLLDDPALGSSSQASLGIDGSGNALLVWEQAGLVAVSRRYTPGSGWAASEPFETTNTPDVNTPYLAVSANGSAVVTWSSYTFVPPVGSSWHAWASRYTPGIGWSQGGRIEHDDTAYAQAPSVAIDGSGNAILVWLETIGGLATVVSKP